MPGRRATDFYGQWLSTTFSSAFKRTGLVNLFVGIALGFVAWKWPALGGLGTTLRWMLPVLAFVLFFIYHAFRAPLELMHEVEGRLDISEHRAEAAEAQLSESRDCQAIADYLTKEHHYGIHELLHKPPLKLDDLPEWNRWVDNWNTAIFRRMREMRCSPQDLNHVETIANIEVNAGMSSPRRPSAVMTGDFRSRILQQFADQAADAERALDIPIRMHAIRLTRIADVSTRYAQRAEEIRLAVTKQLVAR